MSLGIGFSDELLLIFLILILAGSGKLSREHPSHNHPSDNNELFFILIIIVLLFCNRNDAYDSS